MFNRNRKAIRWFLVSLLIFNLFLLARVCTAQGFSGVNLDSIAPTRTVYTYVFSGRILCHDRPCANARVDLDLVTANRGAIEQSTQAGDDGRYQIAVSVSGSPEESSLWKLEAHTSNTSGRQSAQAEGRIILMEDDQTVVVDRSLLLTQA